jgi:hypothetical protein
MKVRRGIRFLPAFGAASLTLAHLLTAAAFRRKSHEIFARLENMAAGKCKQLRSRRSSKPSRAVGRNPVPRAVWLRQTGEMRVMPNAQWRVFTAEQVISVHRPFCLARPHAGDAAAVGSYPRRLCRWRGFARSAILRLITAGAGSGTRDQQGRIDAVSCRTDMGTARDATQSATVLARNRCVRG